MKGLLPGLLVVVLCSGCAAQKMQDEASIGFTRTEISSEAESGTGSEVSARVGQVAEGFRANHKRDSERQTVDSVRRWLAFYRGTRAISPPAITFTGIVVATAANSVTVARVGGIVAALIGGVAQMSKRLEDDGLDLQVFEACSAYVNLGDEAIDTFEIRWTNRFAMLADKPVTPELKAEYSNAIESTNAKLYSLQQACRAAGVRPVTSAQG